MNQLLHPSSIRRQLGEVLAEGMLLLTGGFGLALIATGRYHPIFAGEPFRALSFWQQGLCGALFLGLLEFVLVSLRKPQSPSCFPLGVQEVRSWFLRGCAMRSQNNLPPRPPHE